MTVDLSVLLCQVHIFRFLASSTTEVRPMTLPDNPNRWTIDDVVRHISETDSSLVPFTGLFRKHVGIFYMSSKC